MLELIGVAAYLAAYVAIRRWAIAHGYWEDFED